MCCSSGCSSSLTSSLSMESNRSDYFRWFFLIVTATVFYPIGRSTTFIPTKCNGLLRLEYVF